MIWCWESERRPVRLPGEFSCKSPKGDNEGAKWRQTSEYPPPTPGSLLSSCATRKRLILAAVIGIFCLATAIVPLYRAFHVVEVNYNEGWNVYLAITASHHLPLYPAKYSWKPVVYPALSFYVMAELSKVTNDYLYTGRAVSLVSLLICCILVGAITKRVTGATLPAFLSGCFCLALFCTAGSEYVGMNDPQMLAQVLFLSGLLLYLSRRPDAVCLAGAAFLFVLGGAIKHSPIYFPLAVFLDLCVVSGRRALQYLIYGLFFLGAAIVFNIHVGGPFFIANILTPRLYSFPMAVSRFVSTYSQLQLPLLGAAFAATRFRGNTALRVVSIWFILSLIIGVLFAGGGGVNVNAFFGNFLSMSVLVGILISFAWAQSPESAQRAAWLEIGLAVVLFGALVFPWKMSLGVRLPQRLRDVRIQQVQFQRQVRVLQDQPGPALCNSLLRCYLAGKPYTINPFDSANLVLFGKLNGSEIVNKIQRGEYGAIQLDRPLGFNPRPTILTERTPEVVLDAIGKYYVPILEDPDCAIYIPQKERVGATQTVALYH